MNPALTCNKVQYGSESAANNDIERIKRKSNRATIPVRSYLCKICNTWHLTSKEDFSKVIPELRLEIDELKKEIEKLTILNRDLKTENSNFKSQGSKEERAMVRADERVKKLKEDINKKDKLINGLRKDNAELIYRILQLNKKLENK